MESQEEVICSNFMHTGERTPGKFKGIERIGEDKEGGESRPYLSGIDEYRYQHPLIRTQTRDSIGRYRMGLLSVREQDRKGEVHTRQLQHQANTPQYIYGCRFNRTSLHIHLGRTIEGGSSGIRASER